MSITIHLVRHGQGLHNIPPGNYQLPDPKLTPLGEQQCLTLRKTQFQNQSKFSIIAASPLTRAIHSAYATFQPALQSKGSPTSIIAIPDAQETSDDPCDIGSDPELLRQICKQNCWPVDLSLVKQGWNIKSIGGHYSPGSVAISRRARNVRRWLREQGRQRIEAGETDVHIALVAHGGFMHYLTEDWEDAGLYPATGWVNCETRRYVFIGGDDDEDEDARILETMESRRSRGRWRSVFGREMQRVLYRHAMKAWEGQGLQNHAIVDPDEGAADIL